MKSLMHSFALALAFVPLIDVHADPLPVGVKELVGVEASLPTDDLGTFDQLLNQSKILAVGESAHGSAGYSKFQHRLAKYAIENFGYRKVLVELVSDARSINSYVQTCQGSINQALYNNPWHDDHTERRAFYEWLCQYNQQHPNDKVTVASVDPQKSWEDAPVIRSFLHDYSTQLEAEYATGIEANCFGAAKAHQIDWAFSQEASDYYANGGLPEDKHQACMGFVTSLEEIMDEQKISMITAVGPLKYFDAVDALRSLSAWQRKSYFQFSDFAQALAIREEAFGPSVMWKWLRNNPTLKPAILLAHNVHISKEILQATSANDPWEGLKPVGKHLKAKLHHKYNAIAQSGYQISAMFSGNFPIPTSPDSIDVTLNALAKPYLVLNTNVPWVQAKPFWYTQEETIPNGRLYDLDSAFERLVFHAVSPASIRLGNLPKTQVKVPFQTVHLK